MSSDYSPRSGGPRRRSRRGGSRGGRRNEPRNDSAPRGERREGGTPPTTFLDRLKSFFGIGKKAPVRAERAEPGERSQHPTLRRAEEQQRSQGQGRNERGGERGGRGERSERSERGERADRPERAERPRKETPKPELEAPNPDAVTIPRLYIGNLSYETAESDLFDLFSKVGSVKNVELVMDRRSNRSKGFGFIEMADLDVAKQAVMQLHRSDFMGRQLVVSGAKSERRPDTQPSAHTGSEEEEGNGPITPPID